MKQAIAYTSAIALLLLGGCYTDKSKRNIEYAPNMYNSLPLEPYSQTVFWESNIGGNYEGARKDGKSFFANGLNAQKAPEGTVPRSESWYAEEAYAPYIYPNTLEGYELAGAELKSPLDNAASNDKGFNCTEETFQRGKVLYEIHCVMCHGANGNGQGVLVQKGAYGGVPAYNTLKNPDGSYMPAGKMFHSLTWGKNSMGSYASQMTQRERWEVICYIQKFQAQ
jgi:hypothetical protein